MKQIFILFSLLLISNVFYTQTIDQQLIQAAYDGDEALVKSLLSKGANPNKTDKNGYPALIYACAYGYEGIVNALLDKKANPKGKYNDVHPMTAAVNSDNTKIMKSLIDAGAFVNCADDNGYTPLMYAAQEGFTKSAEFLLMKGADVNAETKEGHTALSIAVQNGHTEVVKVILKYNPKKKGYTSNVHSPLNTAIYLRKPYEKDLLKKYGMKKNYGLPSFEHIFIGAGMEFSLNEYLFAYKLGLHENVYNFDIILSYAKNPDSTLYENPVDQVVIYNASGILLKNFNIIPTKKGFYGISLGGYAASYYGFNSPLNKWDTEFIYGANAGIYFRSISFYFKVNYSRVLNPVSHFAYDRIMASIYLRIWTLNKSKSRYIYADKTLNNI